MFTLFELFGAVFLFICWGNIVPTPISSALHTCPRGVTRGAQLPGCRVNKGAPNHSGSPKSPNNVTSTSFHTVRLLPKDLSFEHGGAKLASCPGHHLTSLRPVLANTARFSRFFSLRNFAIFSYWGIADFGIALAKHRNLVSALSFYKSSDQKPFLTDHAITCGLTSFICLWCNARIVAIGGKVLFYHMLPFMKKERLQFGCGYL